MRILFKTIIFLLISTASLGQNEAVIDSLLKNLELAKEDTSKLPIFTELVWQYMNMGSFELSVRYSENIIEIANELPSHLDGMKEEYLAKAFNGIGNTHYMQGNYEKAIESYLKSLRLQEKTGNKKGIAGSFNNIGNIQFMLGNFEKALENYQNCVEINETIGNVKGTANAYGNIANIYWQQGNHEKTLEYLLMCLRTMEELGDKQGMATSYTNIGNIYFEKGDFKRALESQQKCLEICEEIGNKNLKAMALGNIGGIYKKQGKMNESFNYLNQSLNLYEEIGNKEGIKEDYASFADYYEIKQDYKQALKYRKLYADMKDTLLNAENSKLIAEMNTKYDSEKKDKELIKKEAEITKQRAESEREVIVRNAFIVGFSLVLVLVFFIFRSYNQKKAANKLLDEKNKKITDSIDYAKRIQQALLPSIDEFKKLLPHSFVLFQPKDIVSGDFYWMHTIDSDQTMIAAVDCTGHGVPGSLMSMLCYNLLDQVVKEKQIYEPASVLNELSKLVVKSLKQTGKLGEGSDGMDMALCKLNHRTNEMEFAGAHNSLYRIRNGALEEIKADWKSIGISIGEESSFTNHTIQFEKGDSFYLFSDGYADQKGGPENNKFFYKPFRQLLVDINSLSMEEQQQKLERVIDEWRGDKEQVDDVLVIGLKI